MAYYQDREGVRKAFKELKETPYGISEQYPRKVMDTRKHLIIVMNKAREENKEAFMQWTNFASMAVVSSRMPRRNMGVL